MHPAGPIRGLDFRRRAWKGTLSFGAGRRNPGPACPGLSSPHCPVCACVLVSSLLLAGATMSQRSSLTQSAHFVRQALTAYMEGVADPCMWCRSGRGVRRGDNGAHRQTWKASYNRNSGCWCSSMLVAATPPSTMRSRSLMKCWGPTIECSSSCPPSSAGRQCTKCERSVGRGFSGSLKSAAQRTCNRDQDASSDKTGNQIADPTA